MMLPFSASLAPTSAWQAANPYLVGLRGARHDHGSGLGGLDGSLVSGFLITGTHCHLVQQF
jgi:hypothetical protein